MRPRRTASDLTGCLASPATTRTWAIGWRWQRAILRAFSSWDRIRRWVHRIHGWSARLWPNLNGWWFATWSRLKLRAFGLILLKSSAANSLLKRSIQKYFFFQLPDTPKKTAASPIPRDLTSFTRKPSTPLVMLAAKPGSWFTWDAA